MLFLVGVVPVVVAPGVEAAIWLRLDLDVVVLMVVEGTLFVVVEVERDGWSIDVRPSGAEGGELTFEAVISSRKSRTD